MHKEEKIQKGDYAVAITVGSDGDETKEGVVCVINGDIVEIRDQAGRHACLKKYASKVVAAPSVMPFVQKVRHELFY
jgi:hypothetical protein